MRHVDSSLLEQLGLPTQFPSVFFPSVIERYRQNLVAENRTPGEFVAGGILAAFSAATGNSVVGRLGTERFIAVNLFMLMIGNPGCGKSPATNTTLKPIRREQNDRERAASQRAMAPRCLSPLAVLGDVLDSAEHLDGNATTEGISVPATLPPVRYIFLSDATIAAVWYALHQNPRGLVMVADEAQAMFKGTGSGGDRAVWLQIWNAENVTVARKSGKPPVVTIPRSFVTIVAGTQPDLFPRLRNRDGDDGLLDRFLLLGDRADNWPPYSHGRVDSGLIAEYNAAVDRMIRHRDGGDASTASFAPAVLQISDECSSRFEVLHNRLTDLLETLRANRRYGGLITKMVANAQRLAVLRASIRWAVGENGAGCSPESLTLADAEAACQVAEFCFGRALLWRPELIDSEGRGSRETPAIVGPMVAGSEPVASDWLAGKIVTYMGRRGITHVEIRQLRSCGGFGGSNTDDLRDACQHLVDQGEGHWADKPGREFVLLAPNKHQTTAVQQEAVDPVAS